MWHYCQMGNVLFGIPRQIFYGRKKERMKWYHIKRNSMEAVGWIHLVTKVFIVKKGTNT